MDCTVVAACLTDLSGRLQESLLIRDWKTLATSRSRALRNVLQLAFLAANMLGRIKHRMRRGKSQGSDSDSSRTPTKQRPVRMTSPPAGAFRERKDIDYNLKVEELAAFDSCVEACDALAASSSYAQSSSKLDKETGLQDCSVLVSPDGDLLLIPQDAQDATTPGSKASMGKAPRAKEDENQPKSPVSPVLPPLIPGTPASNFGGNDDDEYKSAVVMGNDLRADKTINGFSAMGWAPSATSLALRQTSEALREMTVYVEALILAGKDNAARQSHACDQLRSAAGMLGKGNVPPMPVPDRLRPPPGGKPKSRWLSSNNESNGFEYDRITALEASPPLVPNEYNRESRTLELSASRVGPLIYSGGTLHAATVALENYQSTMAENDNNRWRLASKSQASSVGVLPAMRKASDQTADRAYRREKALKEMQSRAIATEQTLAMRKEEAKQRWQAVHEAEEEVTRIVEERMMERSRERERRRMELLQKEEDIREAGITDLGATPAEIWDIVSAASEFIEDGSFSPVGLPQAPVAGPRDKTQSENREQAKSNAKDSEEAAPVTPRPRAPSPSLPMASRTEIEHECRLPELRAAAMAADEAIEDTAGSLLNILSTLDTTRRSARVAAETCLLSAAHAQASCIRSLVAIERAAIEDRLQHIAELERAADNIDVRSDLDGYINADKTERGGSTWLGDDDDGGVASALAILSSHVDGSMGLVPSSRVSTEGWDGMDDEDITPEKLEDAIEDLFEPHKLLLDNAKHDKQTQKARDEYEATVTLLCNVAEDPSARSRRSTICYALNSKRSSDAEISCKIQFDGLCRLFLAILSGCDREAGGVSNAKMCMMLAQTFYMIEQNDKDAASSGNDVARHKRIFIKSRIMDHPIWVDEEFW